jgi:hypothetical protein
MVTFHETNETIIPRQLKSVKIDFVAEDEHGNLIYRTFISENPYDAEKTIEEFDEFINELTGCEMENYDEQ